MGQATLRRAASGFGLLQIVILVLVLATALVHLDRGLTTGALSGHAGGFPGGHTGNFPRRTGGAGGSPSGLAIMQLLPVPLPVLFILNFVGYIVLGTALYLPALKRYQRAIRWVLVVFTAVTIIAWFLIAGSHPDMMGYIDKLIEAALIILLVIDDWQSRVHQREALSISNQG